jgi:hypothetical protein
MKNKRHIIIFAVLLILALLPNLSFGQRYLRAMNGIHVTGGYVPKYGFDINAGWSMYDKWHNRWIVSGDYLQKFYPYSENSQKYIPLRQYCANIEFYRPVAVSGNRNFFFSLGLGVIAGYESINDGKKMLADGGLIQNRDMFIYGATAGLECEYYYNNSTVFLFGVKERFVWPKNLSIFHTNVYIGLKFMLFANE